METMKEQKKGDVEKQIGGCMAGFFNIFDKPHILSPKRFALPKRIPSSPAKSIESESEAESERSSSPFKQMKTPSVYSTPELRSPVPEKTKSPTKSPLMTTLPVMESRSPWRFSKEAPRLSLDSRAASLKPSNGSPSVIARLMGLEPLPNQQQPPLQRSASESRVSREYRFVDTFNFQNPQRDEDLVVRSSVRVQPARAPPSQRCIVRPKSFYDSTDFFPEPREEATRTTDLETLKQLLEALRLKGLLHSSIKPNSRIHRNSNLVFESPVKYDRFQRRDSSPVGIRSRSGISPSGSPKRDRNRARSENSVRSPNARPTLKELRRWRRPEPVHTREEAEEEIWKVDDYNRRQGQTLLERCDKLLHSISQMASEAGADSQPSPVSVLDASLYHDDSSPSPVMKRTLDFTESEDDSSGGSVSSSSDSEYIYISDILRASDYLPQETDVFSLLEKQQYLKGKCASRAAAQHRRLIFDAVQEILGRRKRLPPWRTVGEGDKMQVVWSDFQKLRQNKCARDEEEDLVGYVSGVLGRDLTEDPWRDCPVEMSEVVLDIERLIFKDVIGETIHNLAALNRSDSLLRRRLFF